MASYSYNGEFLCRFGCCPDGVTIAKGPKQRNCPWVPCHLTVYGCCPKNETHAKGFNYLDCPEIDMDNCTNNYFGCCHDEKTPGSYINCMANLNSLTMHYLCMNL